MTVITPPYVLQGGSHPAATFRQIQQGQMGSPFGSFAGGVGSAAAGGGHGVAGATDLAVAQNGTPNMSVNVAGGVAFIRGTEASSQGVYGAYNDATLNVAISASDPTNPRIDLVVMKVRDSFYSGASNDASIVVVTGTPAGAPAVPTPPANALVLAQIAVAAAATTIVNANITDKRTRAAGLGGIIPYAGSTLRPSGASLFEGLLALDTTLNRVEIGNDTPALSALVAPAYGAWTSYTPVWSSTGTAVALGNATINGSYIRIGRLIVFRMFFASGSTSTYGTGSYLFTLPVAAAGAVNQAVGAGDALDVSSTTHGAITAVLASSTTFVMPLGPGSSLLGATSPFTFANGDTVSITGTYEAAADA